MTNATGRRQGQRATVRDVARHAGVSVGTVSHVLNNSKTVSDTTRRSVLEAVAALHYQPNSLARSLIARRPRPGPAAEPGRPRLIALGYISIDYMVRIDAFPHSGERTTSRSIEKMLGGPAANVAAFAAALGAPLDIGVELITRLGTDADSVWALEELAARNVDASGAHQQQGERLSRCIVLVEQDGQRTIINEPFHVPLAFLARNLSRRPPDAAPACVHFDGFHLAAAEQAHGDLRDAGYLMSLHSAGLPPESKTIEGCRRLLQEFDLLFLDEQTFSLIARTAPEIAATPERVFSTTSHLRCRALLLTRGPDGAVMLRPGQRPVPCPAPRVDVADVTGAGDAFAGIFLGAWLCGHAPETALAQAVRGASLSITALGAQGRLCSATDLKGATAQDVGA